MKKLRVVLLLGMLTSAALCFGGCGEKDTNKDTDQKTNMEQMDSEMDDAGRKMKKAGKNAMDGAGDVMDGAGDVMDGVGDVIDGDDKR